MLNHKENGAYQRKTVLKIIPDKMNCIKVIRQNKYREQCTKASTEI